jgi:hypothetical protein
MQPAPIHITAIPTSPIFSPFPRPLREISVSLTKCSEAEVLRKPDTTQIDNIENFLNLSARLMHSVHHREEILEQLQHSRPGRDY